MKYSILSIDKGSANLGNRLIEYCLKTLLCLPSPAVELSMFVNPNEDEIFQINKTDFLLLPGSTILSGDPGQSLAMSCMKKIKVPIFTIGCSGWLPYYDYSLEYLNYIQEPIGVRDLNALKFCEKSGKKAVLVGCPTLFFPKFCSKITNEYSIVGFAREDRTWQYDFLKQIKGNLICSIQEPSAEGSLARSLSIDCFDYANPIKVINYYMKTKAVYTGRLHGILPGIAQGKSVCFFGNPNDSRFTLLTHLGIKIIPIGISGAKPELQEANYKTVKELENNFYDLAKELKLCNNNNQFCPTK